MWPAPPGAAAQLPAALPPPGILGAAWGESAPLAGGWSSGTRVDADGAARRAAPSRTTRCDRGFSDRRDPPPPHRGDGRPGPAVKHSCDARHAEREPRASGNRRQVLCGAGGRCPARPAGNAAVVPQLCEMRLRGVILELCRDSGSLKGVWGKVRRPRFTPPPGEIAFYV